MGSIIEGMPHESNLQLGVSKGFSVSLSNDGTIVARLNDEENDENNSYDVGQVRLFKFEHNSWVQLGQILWYRKVVIHAVVILFPYLVMEILLLLVQPRMMGGTASGHVRKKIFLKILGHSLEEILMEKQ